MLGVTGVGEMKVPWEDILPHFRKAKAVLWRSSSIHPTEQTGQVSVREDGESMFIYDSVAGPVMYRSGNLIVPIKHGTFEFEVVWGRSIERVFVSLLAGYFRPFV